MAHKFNQADIKRAMGNKVGDHIILRNRHSNHVTVEKMASAYWVVTGEGSAQGFGKWPDAMAEAFRRLGELA